MATTGLGSQEVRMLKPSIKPPPVAAETFRKFLRDLLVDIGVRIGALNAGAKEVGKAR
jgi:hypothetical protein